MQQRKTLSDDPLLLDPLLPELVVRGGEATPEQFSAFAPPAPSPGMVVSRALAWGWGRIRFGIGNAADRLRGQHSMRRQAVRLRELFTSMGGPAIVAAQQISMRLDLLPLEFATELSKLQDSAEPMPIEYALERIQRAVQLPLEEVFTTIDPKPIGSDTIACVYQAMLANGDRVAIRVRQPNVAKDLNAERVAISLLLGVARPFFPRQVTMLQHLQDELPQILLENLDFRRVARLQRLFRKQAKKARLRHLSAAKVFPELSSDDVIVSEFVSGVWLGEVIGAQERQDDNALAALASMNIDPAICGKRLLHAAWWSFFENLFLCQMPDPGHIVVRPGNRLVFINLGDTGILGWRQQQLLQSALEKLSAHDVEGAVSMLVQLLVPLPYIDVHEFTKRVEGRMWTQLFAMENDDSLWWERAGTGLWLALLETAQQYGVSVRLDISRMIQASCMYDHMAARLWPAMRSLKEFKRYRRKAQRRQARRFTRKMARRMRKMSMIADTSQQQTLLSRLNLWLASAVDNLPLQFIALTKKGAYSTSQTVWALMMVARLALVVTALRAGYLWWVERSLDLLAALRWTVTHPLFFAALLVIFVTTARRVLFRLDDVDHDS